MSHFIFQNIVQKRLLSRQCLRASALLIIFALSWQASAGSPVWKVSKGNSELYLGGTMHLLAQSDLPLPSQFDAAYSKATSVIFETDIDALQRPEFMAKMMKAMTFRDGRTLQTVLKPPVYADLKKYLARRGIPEASIAVLTPTGASLTIQLMEYQLLGMSQAAGVDTIFSVKAKQDGKTLGSLETPDEQLAFLETMGRGKENEMILQTLNDVETVGEKIDGLKSAWRKGDNRYLAKLAVDDMKATFPHMYDTLLTQRNNKWLPKIEAMLRNKDVELVLVGAMHLVGDDGLLKALREKGYTLENLKEI